MKYLTKEKINDNWKEKKLQRKSNIKQIIILSIIAILLITGVVLYFTTDIFRTKRSSFLRYFNSTTNSLSTIYTADYKEYNNE